MSATNEKRELKILGIYQIAGTGAGFFSLITYIRHYYEAIGEMLLPLSISCILLLFSAFCGVRLLTHGYRALSLTLVNQYLQLISMVSGVGSFQFIAGIYLTAGYDFEELHMSFGAGLSAFSLSWGGDDTSYGITMAVNLVALFLILYIPRMKRSLAEIETEEQVIGLFKTEADDKAS